MAYCIHVFKRVSCREFVLYSPFMCSSQDKFDPKEFVTIDKEKYYEYREMGLSKQQIKEKDNKRKVRHVIRNMSKGR